MDDLWTNLSKTDSPIVLYGMGNGADKIIRVLEEKGIAFNGVFSSDGFQKSGKTFHGFDVTTLSELEKKYGSLTVLMCFGSQRKEVIENVKQIKSKHSFFAPDVPVYGNILFDADYYSENKNRFDYVCSLLADDISKKTFENTVKYKLTGNVDYLFECEVEQTNPYDSFLNLNDNETFLDLGAYRGDTVFEFLQNVRDYNEIIAVEPDIKTFAKLEKNLSELKRTTLINAAVSSVSKKGMFCMNGSRGSNYSGKRLKEIDYIAVDNIISSPITYIKADVEGAELDFIMGAKKTISKLKPKMQIACYHRSEDLFTIPEAVLNIRDDYKVYMRHFSSLPAWDTIYYFV